MACGVGVVWVRGGVGWGDGLFCLIKIYVLKLNCNDFMDSLCNNG